MLFNPTHLTDAYKLDHRRQYPEGTTRVYSNLTPRGSRMAGIDYCVFFGLQAFLKEYVDLWARWFAMPKSLAIMDYQHLLDSVLGPNEVGTDHIAALHSLGYLPLEFRALPEGSIVPLRVPLLTVENTHDEFFWLTNYIETALSSALWLSCTSATTAYALRKMLESRARVSGDEAFVDWQGHDFSMRGMSSIESGAASGAGHLLSFTGTDTLSALDWINVFYPGDNGFIGGSVPATEHSVMCAGSQMGEYATFCRLLDLYPTGTVSVVSDTWDLWHVVAQILPALKDKILARDGKLVIRPDSGDPADILCGTSWVDANDKTALETMDPAEKGLIQCLYDIFGGTKNAKGFIELDPHIGAIYGDSITFDRAADITHRLMEKGFASTNVVLGVGSYTYQYKTRDSLQMAMKATWAEVNGEGRDLFKNPITDDGLKKSAKGRLAVLRDSLMQFTLVEGATAAEEDASLLELVFRDGWFAREQSFADVRAVLRTSDVPAKGLVAA